MKCEGEDCLTETEEREIEEIIKTSDQVLLSEGPTEISQVSDPRNFLKSDTEETENTSKLLEPREVVTEQNIAINFEIQTEIDKTITDDQPSSLLRLSSSEIDPKISVRESGGRNDTLIPVTLFDSREDQRVCTLSHQVSAS